MKRNVVACACSREILHVFKEKKKSVQSTEFHGFCIASIHTGATSGVHYCHLMRVILWFLIHFGLNLFVLLFCARTHRLNFSFVFFIPLNTAALGVCEFMWFLCNLHTLDNLEKIETKQQASGRNTLCWSKYQIAPRIVAQTCSWERIWCHTPKMWSNIFSVC